MDSSLQHRWLIDGRVRLVTLQNDLRAATIFEYDHEIIQLMDEVSAPLHFIVDVRSLRTFPNLNECMSLQHFRHEKMGWLLTIGTSRNQIMRFFLNAIARATHARYKEFDEVAEAVDFLELNQTTWKDGPFMTPSAGPA